MRQAEAFLRLLLFAGVLGLVNLLAHSRWGNTALYRRFDLTADNRFTLTPASRQVLRNLDDVVTVRVLLEGDFPAGYERLRQSVEDMLLDFRQENAFVETRFEDPLSGNTEQINQTRKTLAETGILPVSLNVQESGERRQKLTYPYAIFYYKGRSVPVNFLENQIPGVPPDVVLNKAVNLLEYKFIRAINQLRQVSRPAVLFTAGHGELVPSETADLEVSLRETYQTGRLVLDSVIAIDSAVKAVVIASPKTPFSERDLFKVDQYLMQGGRLLFLIDKVGVHLDSLRRGVFLPNGYDTQLDDMLFKYGARLQANLILDMQSSVIPLATGRVGDAAQFEYFRYPYHVVAIPQRDHPAVKNTGPLNMHFVGSIDTIQTRYPVRKTILLESSPNSRYQFLPLRMDFEFLRYPLEEKAFNKGPQTLALLLEGSFSSLFENRVSPAMAQFLEQQGMPFRISSDPGRIIVVSDADFIRSRIDRRTGKVIPAGYNEFERYTFANKDFALNAIEYLCDDAGLLQARGKDISLRLLDMRKVKKEKEGWQLLNLGLPLLGLSLLGWLIPWWRRRRNC